MVRRILAFPLRKGLSRNYSTTVVPAKIFDPSPAAVLYANPVCSQMDQLLHQAPSTDRVLELTVTHRGVFFVHNLVTALSQVAALNNGGTSEEIEEIPLHKLNLSSEDLATLKTEIAAFNKDASFKKDPPFSDVPSEDGLCGLNRLIASITNGKSLPLTASHAGKELDYGSSAVRSAQRLIKDERYDLLLRDLRSYTYTFDAQALISVGTSLRVLDHRMLSLWHRLLNYAGSEAFWDRNFSGFAAELLETKVSECLSLLEHFQWVGYLGESNFYARSKKFFILELENIRNPQQLVEIGRVFGGLDV